MADTLSCPSCGAPVLSPVSENSLKCSYCGRLVSVPEEFRVPPSSGISGEQIREIKRYIRAGQKIQAIKALRLVVPIGLAEAKDRVERAAALLAARWG